MGIRISDSGGGGGDQHTQNPPPEHDAGALGGCSSSSTMTVTADAPIAPADAPEVLRGVTATCGTLVMPQAFAEPVGGAVIDAPVASPEPAAAMISAPSAPTKAGGAMSDAAAKAVGGGSAAQEISMNGGAGMAWAFRESGEKYNVGTAEAPELRKVAPRWASAMPGAVQQMAEDFKVRVDGVSSLVT